MKRAACVIDTPTAGSFTDAGEEESAASSSTTSALVQTKSDMAPTLSVTFTQASIDTAEMRDTHGWGRLLSMNPRKPHIDLFTDEIRIGRGTLSIRDAKVSKEHLVLTRAPTGACVVQDLSSNGTFLNGKKIGKGQSAVVYSGDEISLVIPSYTAALQLRSYKDDFLAFILQRFDEPENGGRSDGEHTQELSSEQLEFVSLPAKRAHTIGTVERDSKRRKVSNEPKRQYYQIDEAALLKRECRAVIAGEENVGECRIIHLKRPHVADMSYAAQEFKKAELAFRRFVNKDLRYHVTGVDIVISPLLERRKRRYSEKREELNSQGAVDLVSRWVLDPKKHRTMTELHKELFQQGSARLSSTSLRSIPRGDVSLLAWHGTPAENLHSICKNGFENRSTTDEGWFGRGMYFTQMPCYGEFYIDQLQEKVENAELLLSWVLLGDPFPVTNLELSGGGLREGFDSHYVLVDNFEPIAEGAEPTGDEIVIFDGAQVLPRYIVKYECVEKKRFDPFADDVGDHPQMIDTEVAVNDQHEQNESSWCSVA